MKIILIKDVPKLGKRYEIKNTSDGHALNLLIPQGLAIAATPDAIKRIETLKKKTEGELKVQEELLVKNLKSIEAVTLTITGKANDKGHLFAGLHATDIAKELAAQAHITVDPSFIQLSHPLKEVGEHTIELKASGKVAKLKLIITASK